MTSPIEKGTDATKWMKRKRTRRHCNINSISQPSPQRTVTSSASSSADFSGITTEEEEIDLANSLILLSQAGNLKDRFGTQPDTGASSPPPPPPVQLEKVEKTETTDKLTSRHSADSTAHPNPNLNGNYFPCKTCNKCFNSFQALGGHRASHKKPKLASDDQKVQSSADTTAISGIQKLDDVSSSKDEIQVNSPLVKPPTPINGSKVRSHECQICHAVFTTGQALGGHMRRHKPLNGGGDLSKNKKETSGLELDLNFPPSEHDETVQPPPPSVFPFEGNPPTRLLLGSTALTNYLY